jgi:hypothetical protein
MIRTVASTADRQRVDRHHLCGGTAVAIVQRMRWVPLVLVCLTASARADGFYYTEGGGPVNVGDELGAYYGRQMATKLEAGIGMRRADWALEVFTAGIMNPENLPQTTSGPEHATPTTTHPDLIEFGLGVKRMFPVARHFEVYLRGSASVGYGTGTLDSWSGRGLGFGGGAQLKGKGSIFGLLFPPLFWIVRSGPMMTGAVYLDNGYEFYRLHDHASPHTQTAIDAQLTQFTVGFALGSDF